MKATCMSALFRRKTDTSEEGGRFRRCLTTLDLISLGIGATLGAGIYVVVGEVARETAGPSVALSFLIAAIASVLSGLCYAEFGARVPRAGSAYIYSYFTVGELWAFIIGWNLILEYVIGAASVARAFSTYLDSFVNGSISNYFESVIPLHVNGMSPYPDFLAFSVTILVAAVVAFGVKESAIINKIFTFLNIIVVLTVIIAGSTKADMNNWRTNLYTKETNATMFDGFFPFGISGTIKGAATCFYAFVGFDVIATSGEEVINPKKAIPISIICCLSICFVAYFGVSAILTLMVPFSTIDTHAPLPVAFKDVGMVEIQYVVGCGAMAGILASLMGGIFPMPRVIYAMAEDGLLFKFFTIVPEKLKTPLYATIFSGLLAATMAMLFELSNLVEMMSIGTLLAYVIVAQSVLLIRYQDNNAKNEERIQVNGTDHKYYDSTLDEQSKSGSKKPKLFSFPTNKSYEMNIDEYSELITPNACIYAISIFSVSLCILAKLVTEGVIDLTIPTISIMSIVVLIILISMCVLMCQPENDEEVSFKVPMAPILCSISILVNIYLITQLTAATWMRFSIWMSIGLSIYFGYGFWNSKERSS